METIILLQHHLNRVGCTVGKLDGKWGIKSRTSAARFAKTVDQPFETYTPNTKLLTGLKQYDEGVCAPVKTAKPKFKKTKRARVTPTNRKRKKTKKANSRKKKAVVLRKTSITKKVKKKKTVKKVQKIKEVKKVTQPKKVKTVKRKPKDAGVSGDPFSGGSGGSGGGGGWQ